MKWETHTPGPWDGCDYYEKGWWPECKGKKLGVVRVDGKYFVTGDNRTHDDDVGPYRTLKEAKTVAETCMSLDEFPPSLREYV